MKITNLKYAHTKLDMCTSIMEVLQFAATKNTEVASGGRVTGVLENQDTYGW